MAGDGKFRRQLDSGTKPGSALPTLRSAAKVGFQLPHQLVGWLLTPQALLDHPRPLMEPDLVEQQHAVAVQHGPHQLNWI